MRIVDLLATRLRALVGRIPDADDEFLRTVTLEGGSDVERERRMNALVLADFLAVHINDGLPVDATEIEHDLFTSRHFGCRELGLIPEILLVTDAFLYTGESGLDAKRNEDFSVP